MQAVVEGVEAGRDQNGDKDQPVFPGGEQRAESQEVSGDAGPDRVEEGERCQAHDVEQIIGGGIIGDLQVAAGLNC